jgi:subfamily B ATP-binding cassette protein MsbA
LISLNGAATADKYILKQEVSFMNYFNRIFAYIWPQWPRLIVVVSTAIIVALLLSISFLTIAPLLKVMIASEGLHGWIDGKSCRWTWGIEFLTLKRADFIQIDNPDVGYFLQIINIEKDSPANRAGLQIADRIIGLGDIATDQDPNITSAKLLEKLATTKQQTIQLQVQRFDENNQPQNINIEISTELPAGVKEKWFAGFKKSAQKKALTFMYWAAGFIPRANTPDNKVRAIVLMIVAMFIVTILRCIAKYFQGYIAHKVVNVSISNLRADLFEHITNMPVGYFSGERPSDFVSRIVNDTLVMADSLKVLLGKALREPLNAVFMMAAATLLNLQLTLIFMCGAPFVVILLGIFGKTMKKATKKSLATSAHMLSRLQETLAGLRIIKVYGQQQHQHESFVKINNNLLQQLLKIAKVDAATQPILEVLGMAAGSVALIVGAYWIKGGTLDGAEFLTMLVLLGAAAEAVRKTSDIWNKVQRANAAAERVFVIIDNPSEYEKPNSIKLARLQRSIEFRNVVFTYPENTEPTLKDINLTIQAGQNVALVGPNGSGKTTLANLLPRFYNPDSGQIFIDGVNIQDVTLKSLRENIGLVTQNIVTFNDTIKANIAFGKLQASEDEIIQAAKRAFAHDFINQLPLGYNTPIGEYGVGLSGGQLQRIVIARAILKNPAILIFDEATSQVDADSEAKIHTAIEEFMHNRTTFIIAHRFSTVVSADVIVVIDNGMIIEQGRHVELISSCSLYQRLYETQLVS